MHNYALFSLDRIMSIPCAQPFLDGPIEEYNILKSRCLRDELECSFVASASGTTLACGGGVQV